MAKKSMKLPVAQAMPMPTTAMEMKPSKESMEREKRYRAEDALRDIERAEGHKRDKELMKGVKMVAKEKMETMKKIC